MISITELEIFSQENEKLKKENQILKTEKDEIKKELDDFQEQATNIVKDLNANRELIDIDYLTDFLDSHNLLTENLKNEIEYFQKHFTLKQDIEEYVNYLNFVM